MGRWESLDENYRAMRNLKYKPDDESDKPYRERSSSKNERSKENQLSCIQGVYA